MVEKTIVERINRREYQKAIASAIAATAIKEYVKSAKELPIVISDDVQALKKTKDVVALINGLGLSSYIENEGGRIKKGIRRSAAQKRYKRAALFVVKDDNGISKAARNIPGFDICRTDQLRVNLLAPGGRPGRLVIWSESAAKSLDQDISKLHLG
jgi:large subunit ribosomal protein L4e